MGSINCLPETAFEQMIDTKMTFGKMDKRQGYHIIISFVPGETTEEIAFDIVERFAKEYLKDEYEAVYAVHNDKGHMHAHLIFNSVNLVNGVKYEYRKGEWKRRMQPITNKLCKEYNLEIMPAEYAREPKNLSRVEWEQEQIFREMILADAEFCQSQATSLDHFVFLMKRIGYQFEYGKYLSVKVPSGKWYHQLDKLDERFEEEKFHLYLDIPYSSPRFVVNTTGAIYCKSAATFQMKFYRRIYQARMVEQRRFDKHAAYLAKELERMNRLQEQYLFLVKNDIKSVEGLIGYQVIRENEMEKISKRQKTLYQENSVRKRACKTVEENTSLEKLSYEEYKRMMPLEKAENCGFTRSRDYDVVEGVMKLKFMELGHVATVDELMEETEILYKGMRELIVRAKVDEVLEAVEKSGLPFICWTPREKAELLQFQLDDNSYNMQLYNAVCKACGIDISDMDEVLENYQAIYDKTVEMQGDKEVGSREGGRGRVR